MVHSSTSQDDHAPTASCSRRTGIWPSRGHREALLVLELTAGCEGEPGRLWVPGLSQQGVGEGTAATVAAQHSIPLLLRSPAFFKVLSCPSSVLPSPKKRPRVQTYPIMLLSPGPKLWGSDRVRKPPPQPWRLGIHHPAVWCPCTSAPLPSHASSLCGLPQLPRSLPARSCCADMCCREFQLACQEES